MTKRHARANRMEKHQFNLQLTKSKRKLIGCEACTVAMVGLIEKSEIETTQNGTSRTNVENVRLLIDLISIFRVISLFKHALASGNCVVAFNSIDSTKAKIIANKLLQK